MWEPGDPESHPEPGYREPRREEDEPGESHSEPGDREPRREEDEPGESHSEPGDREPRGEEDEPGDSHPEPGDREPRREEDEPGDSHPEPGDREPRGEEDEPGDSHPEPGDREPRREEDEPGDSHPEPGDREPRGEEDEPGDSHPEPGDREPRREEDEPGDSHPEPGDREPRREEEQPADSFSSPGGNTRSGGDLLQNDEDVGNSTASVKVVLVPEGQVVTMAFAIGLSIQELKRQLASELRVPVEVLLLSLDGRAVEEHQSLMELGVRPHSSTRMEMASTDPDTHPLGPLRPPVHDSMPDVITVQVQTSSGTGERQIQEVVVEIERPPQNKLYLGGYRHRLTGAEYHHAAIQTLPRRRRHQEVLVLSRATQTAEMQSKAPQCPVDASTQMSGIGCYVSCGTDRLLTPGTYTTSEQRQDRRLRATICLQSSVRRWLARQAVERLRQERARWWAWLHMQETRRRQEKEEQVRERRRRRMNPRQREDFDLLYRDLQRWRIKREEQINSSLRGAERKAALCALLEEETQLIANIGRHRNVADVAIRERTIKKLLDMSAAPHQWRAADGRLLQMETPDTIRAQELRELYHSVRVTPGGWEQRMKVLMALKHTVQEQKCQLTTDLVELIDRELHLMTTKVEEHNLEGLRRRISTLFLHYIKTPAFNPEVANVLKVPQDPSQLKKDVFCCRRCHRYLSSAEFTAPAGGSLCHCCAREDNRARRQTDFSSYENILTSLRAEELKINKEAKMPFLLQVEDMHHLVEAVWMARSALEACYDLDNLVFVRWDRWCNWSPWNCILLSKEEALAHLDIEDVYKAYELDFVRDIQQKHALARRHFSQNSAVAEYLEAPATAARAIWWSPVLSPRQRASTPPPDPAR